MDLSFGVEYDAFRNEVRAFLARAWNAEPVSDRAVRRAREQEFRAKAVEAGFVYRGIPRACGGSEQAPDPLKALIIREEFDLARAPREMRGNGVAMLVPTLLAVGTEELKQRFIPRTLTGDYIWGQGYSEPGAGSDLAALRTRGDLVDGEWVITGQKLWTTDGPKATHMFVLVRTEPDAAKHAGISYLLVDLRQKGVDVRPLRQITGETEFSEVFFDGARTPEDWIVGARGQGWGVSRTTLGFERNSVGSSEGTSTLFDKLLKLAKSSKLQGKPALDDPNLRAALAALQARVMAHRYAGLRALSRDAAGMPATHIAVMNKQLTADIAAEVASVARMIIGDSLLMAPTGPRPGAERWVNQYFNSIAAALGGGTSNIQRNIIAERALGLPRDAG